MFNMKKTMHTLPGVGVAFLLSLGFTGNAFAANGEFVIIKCQEQLNLTDEPLYPVVNGTTYLWDGLPRVIQYQDSAGIAKPQSCEQDQIIRAANLHPGGTSCAQCISDLLSDQNCRLTGSPVVVMMAEPRFYSDYDQMLRFTDGMLRFTSVEKYTMVCPGKGRPQGIRAQ